MEQTLKKCREALAMLAQDGDMCHWTDAHTFALKDAVAVFAAERTDAERYRWLRAQHWDGSLLCVVADPKDAVKLGHCCPSGDLLDMAVDDAMAAALAVG